MLAVALAVAACSAQTQKGAEAGDRPPLEGARIGGPFVLIDQDGRPRTDRDFAGRWRIMYFGYTFCPDVCPTDMQKLGAGLRLVEAEAPAVAAKVVPVFVTVDPARDDPAALKRFVAAFHPRLVGLTGPQAQIDRLTRAYGVYAAREDAGDGKGDGKGGPRSRDYLVGHSDQAYLMDPSGRPIALVPVDESPRAVADTIARWVR